MPFILLPWLVTLVAELSVVLNDALLNVLNICSASAFVIEYQLIPEKFINFNVFGIILHERSILADQFN